MKEDLGEKRKSNFYALVIAAVITSVLAVPYFYYQYFYDPIPQHAIAISSQKYDTQASITGALSSIVDFLKDIFQGDFSRESIYILEE